MAAQAADDPAEKVEPRRQRRVLLDERRGQARDGVHSILEGRAVKDETRKVYADLMCELVLFAAESGLQMGTREQDEMILLEWADEAFLEGRPSADGSKMWAAYTHYHPARGRLGDPLARARRAMQSWSRLAPSHGRIPPAFPMVCGIVAELAKAGWPTMCLAVLVATSGYLRPGELLNLRGADLVEPLVSLGPAYSHWSIVLGSTDKENPLPTKMGIYDDAVILDHSELEWMDPLLAKLVHSRPRQEPLWDFTAVDFRREFSQAAVKAGLGKLNLVPYSLRHAGPSWDALVHRTPQREIQRRGRWKSPGSVVRYERSSRVLAVLRALPPIILAYLEFCETHLADLVRGACVKQGLA